MMDAPDPPGAFSRSELDFYMQTHEHLRREIEADKEHLRKLNVYVVVGTGTVWSWVATKQASPPSTLLNAVTFIPLLFALFGAIQTWGLVESIRKKAEFIRAMEGHLAKGDVLRGWETWLDDDRKAGKYPHRQDLLFWIVILVVTLVVPCFYLLFKSK